MIEIWFADEARIGQKNKITRRWAKRGTRPSAPKDQRTASAYIFGAICPAEGKGAGLVLPRCTTEGMTLHLKEISQAVTPGAHALVLVDQAGWHQSKKLVVPANITLMPLPAKAPGRSTLCAFSTDCGRRCRPNRSHAKRCPRNLSATGLRRTAAPVSRCSRRGPPTTMP